MKAATVGLEHAWEAAAVHSSILVNGRRLFPPPITRMRKCSILILKGSGIFTNFSLKKWTPESTRNFLLRQRPILLGREKLKVLIGSG